MEYCWAIKKMHREQILNGNTLKWHQKLECAFFCQFSKFSLFRDFLRKIKTKNVKLITLFLPATHHPCQLLPERIWLCGSLGSGFSSVSFGFKEKLFRVWGENFELGHKIWVLKSSILFSKMCLKKTGLKLLEAQALEVFCLALTPLPISKSTWPGKVLSMCKEF